MLTERNAAKHGILTASSPCSHRCFLSQATGVGRLGTVPRSPRVFARSEATRAMVSTDIGLHVSRR